MFLLTNDDGWDAPGLAALWDAAAGLGLGGCRLVAPLSPVSGCGHAVTTHRPIAIEPKGPDRAAVDGTPGDCVRLALHHLAADCSWTFAGINAGGNLGADVYHSGTVAAAREAVLHGVPAVALSHYIARGRAIDWPRATRWAAQVLRQLIDRPPGPGAFWNVNFPHPAPDAPDRDPEIVFCPLDPSPLPLRYQVEDGQALYNGEYAARARRPGSDIDVCFRGQIAVSLVRVFDAGPTNP